MKSRRSILFISTGIILIIILLSGFWLFYSPIPDEAVFRGDHEDGQWIELVDIKENKYHFQIYQHSNEDLLIDSYFLLDKCTDNEVLVEKDLNRHNWKEMDYYFDKADEVLKISDKDIEESFCEFRPVHRK